MSNLFPVSPWHLLWFPCAFVVGWLVRHGLPRIQRWQSLRLIRSVRELDRFDDESCLRLLADIELEAKGEAPIRAALSVLGTFLFFVVIFVAIDWVIDRAGRQAPLSGPPSFVIVLLITAGAASMVVGPIVAARRRRQLRHRIDTRRCRECNYSLLGIPVDHAIARCPECGAETIVVAYAGPTLTLRER